MQSIGDFQIANNNFIPKWYIHELLVEAICWVDVSFFVVTCPEELKKHSELRVRRPAK